jgi:cytochrome c-type biogenesis protein CcmH/NrfG
VISVLSLTCPVCGAPFSPGDGRCGYCGSILVLQTDHPRIDPRALNRAVVDKHIGEYRELLRNDPNSVKAHYGLGVAYFNLGLTEAAIDSLEKACSITPENPHIHTQLAVAWREEAQTGNARAIEEMRDHIHYALRLDPENIEALILASEQAANDHDIESALAYSERAAALEPDRARDLHERNLIRWIEWKVQRGEASRTDIERVEQFSTQLAQQERSWAQGVHRENTGSFSQAFSLSMTSNIGPDPVVKAVRNGCLTGVGITLVSCCVLAALTDDAQSGSGASTLLGLIYIALLFLPFVLAYRAWKNHREKDPFS